VPQPDLTNNLMDQKRTCGLGFLCGLLSGIPV
jgi:hypothetical protein